MLTYVRTSILSSRAQTVVNTVNTVGVMGKGLAAAFRARYPEMFTAYKKLCDDGSLTIGKLWLWKDPAQWVLNFPTKKHWRNPSRLEYVEAGLRKFAAEYERQGIYEIAFPRLGCGNGGLDWSDVGPMMEAWLGKLPITIHIHDFEKDIGVPEHFEVIKAARTGLTYGGLRSDISQVLAARNGMFKTLTNGAEFRAELDERSGILIYRSGKHARVTDEDLYELWNQLRRGPITRRQLPGSAREEAYYLFAILSHLPYIKPVRLGFAEDDDILGIQLVASFDSRDATQVEQRELFV
jgi:O-acetyl-ADP-ribose deacetylase (regulator of RNase III)